MGKYALAMESLKALTSNSAESAYRDYASFYYALAAYHNDDKPIAKSMFRQISERNDKWEHADEVNYWLAQLSFEEDRPSDAFAYLNKLKGKKIKEEGRNMKQYFLLNLDDTASLRQLLEENPYDKDVAITLAENLLESPLKGENRQLLEFLVSEFELDEERFRVSTIGESIKKDAYNIAVVFPFMFDQSATANNLKNNPFLLSLYDFYEGVSIARQDLAAEGIKINIEAYDTKRDTVTTAGILRKESVKNADLIIGPLYPATSKIAQEFAYQNKINIINPVSSNSQVLGNNPYSYLIKSTNETVGSKAAAFATENFEDAAEKRALVIYGQMPQDSMMARAYYEAMVNNDMPAPKMLKVKRESAAKILEALEAIKEEEDTETGHIFVASTDQLVVANFISSQERSLIKIPVIGHEIWLEFKVVAYDQIERLKVFMMAPGLIEYGTQPVEAFKKRFIDENKSLPSPLAYQGYDMMMTLGKLMNEYGHYFQSAFKENKVVQGQLFPGYNFQQANDNQYVPVVQFKDSELILLNKPAL